MREISIHCNINAYMETCKKMEEENRKKAELNWKLAHPNTSVFSSKTDHNQNTFCQYISTNECEIYFYEWSDITRTPLNFKYYTDFYEFLDKSNIILSNNNYNKMKQMKKCYMTCEKGKRNLLLADEYKKLEQPF